jgi:tRNA dimethylallyltransferase
MTATLYFLTGPTAVGKTELALEWAERMNAEIVSCDSLLFYRGMDIGTAKPTQGERARVPHHLIDLVPVSEPFNLPRFLQAAEVAIADIQSRGKQVLIAGGSGFYLYSFFQPIPQELPDQDGVREELQDLQAECGLAGLLDELDRLHPSGTPGLDRNNPHRVFNAVLRSRLLGLSWEEMRKEWQSRPVPFAEFSKQVVRLGRPDEEMWGRIEQRVRLMLQQGLAEEVWRLREEGIEQNPTARTAIGYREILQNPHASTEEWVEQIALHTRQLVRKQEKWFRSKFASVEVLHPDQFRATRL